LGRKFGPVCSDRKIHFLADVQPGVFHRREIRGRGRSGHHPVDRAAQERRLPEVN
jgi:hypothetical protein